MIHSFAKRIVPAIRTTAICLGVFMLLSGAGPDASPSRVQSIGVIVALGDACMFERIPDTAFDWIAPPRANFLEISDWGIDDEVANTITRQLAARYKVQTIAVEHQDFDAWTYNSLQRRIRELPIPETSVDAYLLVLRDWRPDAIGDTDHEVGGLGLYRRDGPGRDDRFGVFASYRIVLLAADSGYLIASRPALLSGRLPWLPAKPSLWPRRPNDVTASQQKILTTDFKTLIDLTLPSTLRRLGLVPTDVTSRHR
jgi:hypothetical protein